MSPTNQLPGSDYDMITLKQGHCVVLEKKFKLWIQDNNTPRKLSEPRKVAGSATCKQSERNCVVLLR